MKPRGRVIYKLEEKLDAIIEALCIDRQLSSRTLGGLATMMAVPYRSLQSARTNGRLSTELESKICKLARVEVSEPTWVDPLLSDAQREAFLNPYPGRDTPHNFRKTLKGIWAPTPTTFRAIGKKPQAYDPDFACHEISDCGQATDETSSLHLFLQADFGSMCDRNGVRYGFRRARLRMDIVCANGTKAVSRLGHGEIAVIRDANIIARGTEQQPTWVIEASAENDNAMLDGEYSTKTDPLTALADYEDGTRIATTLYVNLHDGSISTDGPLEGLGCNKRALIEHLCSMEFAQGRQENGRVDLCSQTIEIKKVNK